MYRWFLGNTGCQSHVSTYFHVDLGLVRTVRSRARIFRSRGVPACGQCVGCFGGAWISVSPKSDWKSEISVRILKRGQALSVWPSLSWMAVPLNVALICEFVLGGCCPLRLSAPSWGATILQTPRWGVAKLIGANLVIGLAYFSSSQKCHLLNRVSAV